MPTNWRRWLSVLFIGGALIGFSLPIIKLYSVHQDNEAAIQTWQTQDAPTDPELTPLTDGVLLGTLEIFSEKSVALWWGFSEDLLSKGAGVDKATTRPGEKGNAVIYGHREEIFWKLKYLEEGDLMTLETELGTQVFEVQELRVTTPDDAWIEKESDEEILTLVTCYPFIYMGPSPERYVVRLQLLNK